MERVKLGEADVDSGTLMVVDPCYVVRRDRDFDDEKEYQKVVDMEGKSMELLGGTVFSTVLGDGTYPVYGIYDNRGFLLRVEILIAQKHEEDPDAKGA